ncbi:MAG: hypothetical protein MJK15_03925 [Colwellia sp.]|nr:hypothetical protein [Colwellia sp.]
MNKIKDLNLDKTFPKEGELFDRLTELIDEYAGEISLVSVLGILELKKQSLILE